MTQRDAVAQHLRDYGGITEETARLRYGVQQLRTRVCELRQAGWSIATCIGSTDAHPYGSHYVLDSAPGEPPLQQELPL